MENTKIPYRFTSDPEHLMACLDKNCRSVLVALIRLSRHYHTEDGVFFRTNKDLEAEAGLAKDTLKHALDAMHIAGVITVYPQKQGQGVRQESCKYRVNHETFMEYEKYDIDDCIKNPDLKIKTTPSDQPLSYMQSLSTSSSTSSPTSRTTSAKIGYNIDNREIDIENNIYKNIYNDNNIIKEPDGNTEPNGYNSSDSSSIGESCEEPTVNSDLESSYSFSDSDSTSTSCSEPTVIKPSCTIPTCSFSSTDSDSTSTTDTPKGVDAETLEVKEQLIPMTEETDGRQASYTNGSDSTVTVPSEVWDGNSCAPQETVQQWKREFNGAIDALVDYDLNHKKFDDKSYAAMKTAIALSMKIWGYDYEIAKEFVQRRRKQHVQWAMEDAEVAVVVEMLNDDPKPTETRILSAEEQAIQDAMAGMFIDGDELGGDDDYDRY